MLSKILQIFYGIVIVILCVTVGYKNLSADNDATDNKVNLNKFNDPKKIVSSNRCANCHKWEAEAWRKTPHYKTYREIHKRKKAKQIIKKLGMTGSIKRNLLCANCHYTNQQRKDQINAISGVSCESCHGGAQDWLALHYKGDRTATRQKMKTLGMKHSGDLYSLGQRCYQCHLIPSEDLVNKGGHPPGSLFDLVSWSQGMERHNFISRNNGPTPKARLRVMYVTGTMLELEYTLRGLAKATNEKGLYARVMTARTQKIVKQLIRIKRKIKIDEINQLFQKLKGIKIKPNAKKNLQEKADQVAIINKNFISRYNGETLAALDPLIPKRYRGKNLLLTKEKVLLSSIDKQIQEWISALENVHDHATERIAYYRFTKMKKKPIAAIPNLFSALRKDNNEYIKRVAKFCLEEIARIAGHKVIKEIQGDKIKLYNKKDLVPVFLGLICYTNSGKENDKYVENELIKMKKEFLPILNQTIRNVNFYDSNSFDRQNGRERCGIQYKAIKLLGKMGKPVIVSNLPALRKISRKNKSSIREEIIKIIKDTKDLPEPALAILIDIVKENHFFKRDAIEIICRRGDKAIPFLRETFKNNDEYVKECILEILGKIRTAKAISLIRFITLSSVGKIKHQALQLLLEHEPESIFSTGVLTEALIDEDLCAKSNIAKQLIITGIKSPSKLQHLVYILSFKDKIVKEYTSKKLVKLETRAIPSLILVLQSKNEIARKTAMKILQKIGDKAKPYLLSVVNSSKNLQAKILAEQILINLGALKKTEKHNKLYRKHQISLLLDHQKELYNKTLDIDSKVRQNGLVRINLVRIKKLYTKQKAISKQLAKLQNTNRTNEQIISKIDKVVILLKENNLRDALIVQDLVVKDLTKFLQNINVGNSPIRKK